MTHKPERRRVRRFERIARRTWLTAAGAALGLPFLEAMRPAQAEASCLTGAPKRLIVMYTPNGTVPASFWPTGEGRDFQLSPILEPLASHQRELLIVGGCDLRTSAGPGDPHQRGTGGCLTGRPLLQGTFSGDADSVAGWASGVSLDQHVATSFGDCAPVRSLEFGVMVEDPTVRGRISYAGAGKPLPPENSPSRLFGRIFEPGLSLKEKELRRARRGYLVDQVRGQYEELSRRLGSEDRQRLESHIESLVELEDQLSRPGIQFGGTCPATDVPTIEDSFDYSQLPAVGAAQLDLMSLMIRCDVTRVASLMWTNSQSGADYPITTRFGGKVFTSTGSHHNLAHKGDDEAAYIAKNVAVNQFFAAQLATLIERLKAIPEGEGTAFDNTLILWTNEQNKGNSHDMADMPYVLAGSAGGAVQTGQYLRFAPELAQRKGAKGENHNRLLLTILQAMGLQDTEFGDPEFGGGVLPGILT